MKLHIGITQKVLLMPKNQNTKRYDGCVERERERETATMTEKGDYNRVEMEEKGRPIE